jgi:addiction module RelB/DinJ family antitoxin
MTNIQVWVADSLHAQAQAVASSMGMDLPSAVRIFLTHMVRENGLPFRLVGDPFFSVQNQPHLEKVVADLNSGKYYAVHDLSAD